MGRLAVVADKTVNPAAPIVLAGAALVWWPSPHTS